MTLLLLIFIYDLFFQYYHWWDRQTADWYGPILRVGGAGVYNACYGQFISMHSPINVIYPVIGSRISKN